jgi:Na+-translocating ferredoxin:NAD+ oxidoreductase RnfG subunit
MRNSSYNYQNDECQCQSNSGFVFGLILGAVIGAVIAVVIYKNNKAEVFEKLEQKIKKFFNDLIPSDKTKPNKSAKTITKKITKSSVKKEITPVFVKSKKPTPKTFIKPKK